MSLLLGFISTIKNTFSLSTVAVTTCHQNLTRMSKSFRMKFGPVLRLSLSDTVSDFALADPLYIILSLVVCLSRHMTQ